MALAWLIIVTVCVFPVVPKCPVSVDKSIEFPKLAFKTFEGQVEYEVHGNGTVLDSVVVGDVYSNYFPRNNGSAILDTVGGNGDKAVGQLDLICSASYPVQWAFHKFQVRGFSRRRASNI